MSRRVSKRLSEKGILEIEKPEMDGKVKEVLQASDCTDQSENDKSEKVEHSSSFDDVEITLKTRETIAEEAYFNIEEAKENDLLLKSGDENEENCKEKDGKNSSRNKIENN